MNNSFGKVNIDKKIDEKDKGTQIVWDAESVLKAKKSIDEGYNLKHSPFYEGSDIDWRRGNISYRYNEFELSEIKKCKKDIIYFAETYCQLMTDKGYANVVLRDYQKELLLMFQNNQQNIALASRQVGKCVSFQTKINIIKGRWKIKLYLLLIRIKLYLENERKANNK